MPNSPEVIVHMRDDDSDDDCTNDQPNSYPPVLTKESNDQSEKYTHTPIDTSTAHSQPPTITMHTNNPQASTSTSTGSSQTSHTHNNAIMSTPNRRIRMYNTAAKGPFTVFIREIKTLLSPIKIALYINKTYPSTIETNRSPGTIKVVLSCVMDANALAADPKLSMYHVSVPAELVEVEGAIDWHDLWDIDELNSLVSVGVGIFNNVAVPHCNIVHAQRLSRLENDPESGQKVVLTNTVKITFNGNLLPNFIKIGSLRVRVRPFHKKPMFCDRCQMFGHTDRFCRRTPKCAKCSAHHLTNTCPSVASRCRYCHNKRQHVNNICPSYSEVTECFKIRENNRRKALYQQAIANASHEEDNLYFDDEDQFPTLHNQYELLPVDDDQQEERHPSHSSAFQEQAPPRNPYAKVVKDGILATDQIRKASKRSRPVFATSRPVEQPPQDIPRTVNKPPAQRRRSSSRNTRNTDNSTSALSAAILSFARNAGVASIWISLLESIIEPLLQAIMPQLPTLLGSLGPAVLNQRR